MYKFQHRYFRRPIHPARDNITRVWILVFLYTSGAHLKFARAAFHLKMVELVGSFSWQGS
jgi:hypothetical protein